MAVHLAQDVEKASSTVPWNHEMPGVPWRRVPELPDGAGDSDEGADGGVAEGGDATDSAAAGTSALGPGMGFSSRFLQPARAIAAARIAAASRCEFIALS